MAVIHASMCGTNQEEMKKIESLENSVMIEQELQNDICYKRYDKVLILTRLSFGIIIAIFPIIAMPQHS